MATNGVTRVLETIPNDIHERTPLVIGSRSDVSAFSH
jgi:fructose-1,6-bisphosphatase